MKEITNHPHRQFTYMTIKDNYPLSLNGNMKKRAACHKPNSYTYKMNESDKMRLLDKINLNYQDLKSVIPTDLNDRKLNKLDNKQNAPKYNNQSGISYLLEQSGKQKHIFSHKRHIKCQSSIQHQPQVKKYGKKTFNHQQQNSANSDQNIGPSTTRRQKIKNDLQSTLTSGFIDYRNTKVEGGLAVEQSGGDNVINYRNTRNVVNIKNVEGEYLGYQEKKKRVLSAAKQRQFGGNADLSGLYPNTARNINYKGYQQKSTIILG